MLFMCGRHFVDKRRVVYYWLHCMCHKLVFARRSGILLFVLAWLLLRCDYFDMSNVRCRHIFDERRLFD